MARLHLAGVATVLAFVLLAIADIASLSIAPGGLLFAINVAGTTGVGVLHALDGLALIVAGCSLLLPLSRPSAPSRHSGHLPSRLVGVALACLGLSWIGPVFASGGTLSEGQASIALYPLFLVAAAAVLACVAGALVFFGGRDAQWQGARAAVLAAFAVVHVAFVAAQSTLGLLPTALLLDAFNVLSALALLTDAAGIALGLALMPAEFWKAVDRSGLRLKHLWRRYVDSTP